MKNLFYFITFLCVLSCYGEDNETQKENKFKRNDYYLRNGYQGNNYVSHGNDKYRINRYDEEYVGNPDLDAEIERPCRVYDLNCIRKYFAEHSKCKIRRGPLPRNLFISQETLYPSRVNLSIILTDVRVGGFRNTRIEEFYINRRTNNMVFSINLRGLTTFILNVFLEFYRSNREPIVIKTEAGTFFPSLTLTAIIPNIDDLQLNKAEITGYADVVPAFFVGPEVLNNTDPTVAQSLVEVFADIPTNTQEMMLTESQFFPPAYIQYNICDFGLRVTPVD